METAARLSRRTALTSAVAASAVAVTAAAAAPAQAAPADDPVVELHRPTATPDRILTTYAGDPATSRAVSWRTDKSVASAHAQIAPIADWTTFEGSAVTVAASTSALGTDLGYTAHWHSAEFTGLQPGTTYLYRVGSEESKQWGPWTEIRTASNSAEGLDILWLGDSQNGLNRHWTRVVQRAYRDVPNAAILLHPGDLMDYNDDDQYWGEWARAVEQHGARIPTAAVPGNHEYWFKNGTRGLAPTWRKQFALPQNGPAGDADYPSTVYRIDFAELRVVALNSAYREAKLGDRPAQEVFIAGQAAWLEEQLRDNPKRWTIATFHHPVYSTAEGRDNQLMRDQWKPLLEKYGVDLVLSGHDHTYGRGYTTASAAGREPLLSGPVYVNSVSGPKMYDVSGDNWTSNGAKPQKLGEDVQTYQHIRIDGDRLVYVSRTASGNKYDGFSLLKRGRRKRLIEG